MCELSEIAKLFRLLEAHRSSAPYVSLKAETAVAVAEAFEAMHTAPGLGNRAYAALSHLRKMQANRFEHAEAVTAAELRAQQILQAAAEVRFADALVADAFPSESAAAPIAPPPVTATQATPDVPERPQSDREEEALPW